MFSGVFLAIENAGAHRRFPEVGGLLVPSFTFFSGGIVLVLWSACFVFQFETFGVFLDWRGKELFFHLVRSAWSKTSPDTPTRCVLKRIATCMKTEKKSLESSRVFLVVSSDRMEWIRRVKESPSEPNKLGRGWERDGGMRELGSLGRHDSLWDDGTRSIVRRGVTAGVLRWCNDNDEGWPGMYTRANVRPPPNDRFRVGTTTIFYAVNHNSRCHCY